MASDPEKEKLLKLVYLLATVGTDVLQKVFMDKLLGYFLEKNKSEIQNVLFQSNIEIVYPKDSSPKLEDLDRDTLKTILLRVMKMIPGNEQDNIEYMRSLLKNHLKRNFLDTFLKDKEKDLEKVFEQERIGNKHLLKLCSSGCAELDTFDIRILCALLFSFFKLEQNSSKGCDEKPTPKDDTDLNAIKKIRFYQKELIKTDQIEKYQDTFDDLKCAIIRLGGKSFQDKIETFKENMELGDNERNQSENYLREWQGEENMNLQNVENVQRQLGVISACVKVLAVVVAIAIAVDGISVEYVLRQMPDSPLFIRRFFDDYRMKDIQSNECKAIGTCQSDSNKCSGSFVLNKCPGHKNIRCCTFSPIIMDTGFCKGFDVRIISRDSWGAMTQISRSYITTPVNIFLIHHTDSEPCNSTFECISRVKTIQTFHMEHKKWSDIGYSFLVGEDGNVYEGRGWKKEGAHTRGKNRVSLAAAMIGNFNERIPNEAALTAVKSLIKCGVSKGMINSTYSLYGHRDFSETVSPGDALYNNMKTWPNFHRNPID